VEPAAGANEEVNLDGDAPAIVLQADSTPAQIMSQLEPAIRAAVVTKKLKDTPEMRQNLLQAAREFQTIASAIPQNNDDLPWWVSRFRLDIMIDAAGRAEPIGLAGGEVRFRFEWFHIQCKKLCAAPSVPLTFAQQNFRSHLKNFIQSTALDLDAAFSAHDEHSFKAHQMRMGIGISAKGNIGVVKGAATVVGQIYFTRDIKRPQVRPRTQSLEIAEEEPLFIIEKHPTQEHLHWAKTNGVQFETASNSLGLGFEEAVYKVDRKVFRKGLKRAAKINQFFARRAARLKSRAWKIFELRTAFDASIGGQLDLVTLAGSTTAQISMFNEKF
jgi:hypothetical protein